MASPEIPSGIFMRETSSSSDKSFSRGTSRISEALHILIEAIVSFVRAYVPPGGRMRALLAQLKEVITMHIVTVSFGGASDGCQVPGYLGVRVNFLSVNKHEHRQLHDSLARYD
jgi:hypothetical protein